MRHSKAELSSASPAALVAFVRSVELGSFAAAAQRLDVSPAAVGQHVRRLERGFGLRLLERTTRRMSVTPEGRLLFERARTLVEELGALERLFEDRDGAVRGVVRVSAPTGISRLHVAPIAARFLAEHPEASVSVDASDAVREVGGDSVDVAFRILRPADSAVVAVRISRLDAITVASPAYLRRRGTPLQPRDLSEHDLVAYRHPASGRRAPFWFRSGGRELELDPAPRLTTNDVETGCRAAEAGAGIAQPPSAYVHESLAAGRLVAILEPYRASPWTLYLCHSGARPLPVRVRAFVDLARRELGKDRFAPPR